MTKKYLKIKKDKMMMLRLESKIYNEMKKIKINWADYLRECISNLINKKGQN